MLLYLQISLCDNHMVYITLFFTALVAATILPSTSEALLATLITQEYHLGLLFVSATAGNTLGACINWWLGLKMMSYQDKKWFPVGDKEIKKAQKLYDKFGIYSLFFAWVPIVGDPLTVVAGAFKIRFWVFLPIVFLGKAARYAVVMLATLGVISAL